jgi:hypothetical protein
MITKIAGDGKLRFGHAENSIKNWFDPTEQAANKKSRSAAIVSSVKKVELYPVCFSCGGF